MKADVATAAKEAPVAAVVVSIAVAVGVLNSSSLIMFITFLCS